jgi:Sporulation and spore germination
MRVVMLVVALAALAVLGSCGVPKTSQVERIDRGNLAAAAGSTNSPAATAVVVPSTPPLAASTTLVPTINVPLYFIVGSQITAVPYALPADPSHGQVLAALQNGPPPGEAGAGLRSAVPDELDLLPTVTDDGSGVATIDLPALFFDAVQPTSDQRLAIAQIARTMLDRPGIGQVRFTLGGAPTGVPKGNGEIAEPGEALSRLAFDDLLVDAPPTTTTTTAPTEPPTSAAPAEAQPVEGGTPPEEPAP